MDFSTEVFHALTEGFLAQMREDGVYNSLMVTDLGCFLRAKGHFRERPEGCDSSVLIFCTGGEGSCRINGGEPHRLEKGRITVLPPHTPHVYYASEQDPWTIFWIHFTGAVSETFAGWSGVRFPLTLSPAACGELEELFRRCFSLLRDRCQRAEYFYLCQLVGQILAIVQYAPATGAPGRGEGAIQAATALMKRRVRDSLTLNELAAESGCSVSHLTQLFRRTQQCPPMEYYLRMKIQAAAKDLYFTDATIKNVAADYGVADPFYFSRLFKRIMGASPSEYRNQIKG